METTVCSGYCLMSHILFDPCFLFSLKGHPRPNKNTFLLRFFISFSDKINIYLKDFCEQANGS